MRLEGFTLLRPRTATLRGQRSSVPWALEDSNAVGGFRVEAA